MHNVTDLTAKLLATENLTVIRTASKTASFDVSARVLNLPLWKDMTPDIEGLFIQHEVGHALFTDLGDWIKTIESFEDKKEQRIIKGYMNVVEDARIEKLMKRRFPGSRKTFFSGYKQLLERDFFKLKGRDVNSMLLIDRINLYFKGGLTLGVKFNDEEKVYVNKVDRCETMDEMNAIALELYAFSKQQAEDRRSMLAEEDLHFSSADDDSGYTDDMDEIESDEFDDNLEDDFSDQVEDQPQEPEDDLESETDRNLNEMLEELADDSVKYTYFEVETKQWRNPIVSYKQVVIDTKIVDEKLVEAAAEGYNHKAEFDKFMTESERMVNYLVKEFEMRKSAQAYRRAQTSKSGSLNMNKIHAYKITDDIFKRITSIPDGKNHGMVFLLDWSGSMQDVIIPTIKQVINLAMFCRRINIPFEVYAFSGQYHTRRLTAVELDNASSFNHTLSRVEDKNILFSDGYFSLLNLFSSKMTNAEFQTIARRFTSWYAHFAEGYSMGDTPLNESLVTMLDFIPEYKRKNNIEKLTLITLSDGAGGSLRSNTYFNTWGWNEDKTKKVKYKNFISDAKTGKTYEVNGASYSVTETLLRMIKDRYDITTLGFYICQNRRRVLESVYGDHFGKNGTTIQIEEMRKGFREHGFYSLKNTGRDDLFVVPDTSTKIVDEELEVDSNASAAAIARKFTKNMGNRKHSRVLLDRFIGYVA